MRVAKHLLLAAGLTAAASAAQAAGTLIYCSEASPEGFDSAQYTGGSTFDAAGHAMFNRLIEFKAGSTNIEPGLAESWTSSPDGLTYTFKLRKGVKFHTTEYFTPSRDFNADDVVFSFMRMIDKNHPFRKAYNVEFPYASDTGLDSNISAVEKTDPYTVVFKLKAPDADLLAKIAMPFASILSAEFGDKLMKEGKASMINQQPVGTGPFILKRYQKDAQIRYAANKQYWKKATSRSTT
ncbi:ABC transporter substrate-binding protein [Vogesella fluminis]|uniref:ABC transporter substrate-binding protein n=1 Tax=Vogesella fluminis TaxID=1069161 RepID=UPI003628272C